MKTAKTLITVSILAALPISAMAQISPYVTAQVEAAMKP